MNNVFSIIIELILLVLNIIMFWSNLKHHRLTRALITGFENRAAVNAREVKKQITNLDRHS